MNVSSFQVIVQLKKCSKLHRAALLCLQASYQKIHQNNELQTEQKRGFFFPQYTGIQSHAKHSSVCSSKLCAEINNCLESRFSKWGDSYLWSFLVVVTSLPFQALTCTSQVTHKVGVDRSSRQLPSSFLFKQLLLSGDSQPHAKSHSLLRCSPLPLDAPSPHSHWECPVQVILHTNPVGRPQLPLEYFHQTDEHPVPSQSMISPCT